MSSHCTTSMPPQPQLLPSKIRWKMKKQSFAPFSVALMSSIIPSVSAALLAQISSSAISDTLLSSLHAVHRSVLPLALDLVDRRAVMIVICPAGRSFVQVEGNDSIMHTCLLASDFCSCHSFSFKGKLVLLLCHHQSNHYYLYHSAA